jgi:hypothetical protein
MLARAGLPVAFVVFLAVTHYLTGVVGSGMPLFAGLIAGSAVWWFCKKLDDERFAALLNPPAFIWPVPMPVSWGVIKDAFDGTFVLRSGSGLAPWVIQREDQSRGMISALLNIHELVSEAQPRTIGLTAKLTPQEGGTQVELKYEVFSPADNSLVTEIIEHTNWRLKEEAKKHTTASLSHAV